MKRTAFAWALSCVAMSTLLAGGTVVAQPTPAPTVKKEPKTSPAFSECIGAPANKTVTFAYRGQPIESKSGTAYGGGQCPNYVVDVVLPSDGGKSETVVIDAGPGGNVDNKAACESYADAYSIQKIGADGKGTRVAGASRRGKWNPNKSFAVNPHCDLLPNGSYLASRPATGSATYRVVAAATKDSKIVPVSVHVSYVPPPVP